MLAAIASAGIMLEVIVFTDAAELQGESLVLGGAGFGQFSGAALVMKRLLDRAGIL